MTLWKEANPNQQYRFLLDVHDEFAFCTGMQLTSIKVDWLQANPKPVRLIIRCNHRLKGPLYAMTFGDTFGDVLGNLWEVMRDKDPSRHFARDKFAAKT